MVSSTKAEINPTGTVATDGDNSTETNPISRPKLGSRNVRIIVRRSLERAMSVIFTCNTVQNILTRSAPSIISSNVRVTYAFHNGYIPLVSWSPKPTTCFDITPVCTLKRFRRVTF